MARSGRQRLGILAVSFDAMGRGILNALVERPGTPHAYLQCCHVAEEAEVKDGKMVWTCWAPEMQWSPPDWAPADGGFEPGLVGAVRSMLNVERWQTPGGGLDLLDIVLIHPADSGMFPASIPEALQRLRRRFKRIGRVLLLVEGTFESPTESTQPGLLRPLPYGNGTAEGPFDFIILLDQMNIEGMAASGSLDTERRAAGLLYHLTVGEMAPVLFSRIQAEQGRLGAPGRYLTLGFEEWRLTSELGIEATSGILYREMAERLLNSLAVPRDGARDPADPWLEEIGLEILDPPQKAEEKESGEPETAPRVRSARPADFPAEDYATRLVQLEDQSQESLRAALRGANWQLNNLTPLFQRRIAKLKSLEALTALKLNNFMDGSYARWYAERQAGRIQRGETQTTFTEQITEPARERVIAFAGLCLAGIVAGIFAWFSQDKVIPSILAGVFGIGALIPLFLGFTRKTTVTRSVVIPPPPDRRAELNFRRGRSYIARQLVCRYERALEAWNATQAGLQTELAVPLDSVPVQFPFSPEVTVALLEEKSISPSVELHNFWEKESAALRAALGRSKDNLPHLLRDFAREACKPLADLGWSDIFRVADRGGVMGTSSWRDALEKARAGALPWLPVPGLSLQTFLAVPRGLSSDLRDTLTKQFPDQKAVEEIDGDAILVFQLSQGYRQPEK